MLEKLFDMKPIGWNSPSSCCCDKTAPVVKLDASHSRQKGLDLDGKASVGAEVMVLFSASKACCLAAPHDQSFNFWVSAWRGQEILEKLRMNLQQKFTNPMKDWTSLTSTGCGQSVTPWTLTGSITTWSLEITSPR